MKILLASQFGGECLVPQSVSLFILDWATTTNTAQKNRIGSILSAVPNNKYWGRCVLNFQNFRIWHQREKKAKMLIVTPKRHPSAAPPCPRRPPASRRWTPTTLSWTSWLLWCSPLPLIGSQGVCNIIPYNFEFWSYSTQLNIFHTILWSSGKGKGKGWTQDGHSKVIYGWWMVDGGIPFPDALR